MPHDNHEHEHEPWPYRKRLLISTAPLDTLIPDVLPTRIAEIRSRDDLNDRVGIDDDFTDDDFNALTGRDTTEQTRWLYDVGDEPDLDPIDDANIAFDNNFQASPILLATLSGHWTVMPGTTPVGPAQALNLETSTETVNAAHIAVVDSGYNVIGTPSWLANRVRTVSSIDQDTSTGKWLGHGKFVSSIIVQQNPNACVWVAALKPVALDKFLHWREVESEDPLDYYIADELALFSAVRRLLQIVGPDGPPSYRALNLSVGTWTAGLSLSGLVTRAALDLWRAGQQGVPIVAAAGNHRDNTPPGDRFVPGQLKLPDLYGVKSLKAADLTTSFFSNEAPTGAIGEGLLGVMDGGTTAHWSGTSFATAVVSAEVAKTSPPTAPTPGVVALDPSLQANLGMPPPTKANPQG